MSTQQRPNPLVNDPLYRAAHFAGMPLVNVASGEDNVWADAIETDEIYTPSLHGRLVGPSTPKTRVEPVYAIPIYDTDVWKHNGFMIPRGINAPGRRELTQNGYTVTVPSRPKRPSSLRDGRHGCPPVVPVYGGCCLPPPVVLGRGECSQPQPMMRSRVHSTTTHDHTPLMVTPIQPDVYWASRDLHPESIMSNMGISHTPSRTPVTMTDNGQQTFLYDNRDPVPPLTTMIDTHEPPQEMIYDPRLTGYGDASRGYIDDVTGQPRFEYTDIDQHRQNRFYTRHALDHTAYGLKNGPRMQEMTLDDVREHAQNTFTDNALSFRTEMQNSLMQKALHRQRQRKQAPLGPMQYMSGTR